jgi:cysteine-rich repeat protein
MRGVGLSSSYVALHTAALMGLAMPAHACFSEPSTPPNDDPADDSGTASSVSTSMSASTTTTEDTTSAATTSGEDATTTTNGDTTMSPQPVCGDGVLDPAECETKGGDPDSVACPLDCAMSCGNNEVEAWEQCDDQNDDEHDACVDCRAAICGDMHLYDADGGTESCDDGNRENSDACVDCQHAYCGDGHVQDMGGVEECDDGNFVDDDECTNFCSSNVETSSTSSG